MFHRTLALAGALLTVPAIAAPPHAAAQEAELGPIKHVLCYDPVATYEGWEGYVDQGAYNVWCYDSRGRRVVRMFHGPTLHVFGPKPAYIHVTLKHYDDRNNDGALTENEVDGVLVMNYEVRTDAQLSRTAFSPDWTQVVVAAEIPLADIDQATGWFEGTAQVINRTNIPVDTTLVDGVPVAARVRGTNFSSLSLLRREVPALP
jgi:hypothetical protein